MLFTVTHNLLSTEDAWESKQGNAVVICNHDSSQRAPQEEEVKKSPSNVHVVPNALFQTFVAVHSCNPNSQKTEARGLAWATQ